MATNLQPLSPGIRFSGIHRAPPIPHPAIPSRRRSEQRNAKEKMMDVEIMLRVDGEEHRLTVHDGTVRDLRLALGEEKR
jgi:hypothetical protein